MKRTPTQKRGSSPWFLEVFFGCLALRGGGEGARNYRWCVQLLFSRNFRLWNICGGKENVCSIRQHISCVRGGDSDRKTWQKYMGGLGSTSQVSMGGKEKNIFLSPKVKTKHAIFFFFFPQKPIATYQNGALIFFLVGGATPSNCFLLPCLPQKAKPKQLAADVSLVYAWEKWQMRSFFRIFGRGKTSEATFSKSKGPFIGPISAPLARVVNRCQEHLFYFFCEMVGRLARGGQKRRERGGL